MANEMGFAGAPTQETGSADPHNTTSTLQATTPAHLALTRHPFPDCSVLHHAASSTSDAETQQCTSTSTCQTLSYLRDPRLRALKQSAAVRTAETAR